MSLLIQPTGTGTRPRVTLELQPNRADTSSKVRATDHEEDARWTL